jgi:hypothetical protein
VSHRDSDILNVILNTGLVEQEQNISNSNYKIHSCNLTYQRKGRREFMNDTHYLHVHVFVPT